MNEQGPRPLIDGEDLNEVLLVLLGVILLAASALFVGAAAGLVVVGYRLVTGG